MTEPSSRPTSAGALLRAAREAQGLHIAALAAAIKVSPRKLDALENDRHDELPDATFARALAQTVCRSLKIDAKPVLDLLPPMPALALGPGGGGPGTPFRERPGRLDPGLSMSKVRPLVWAAALLLLAALLVYGLPASWLPASWWPGLSSAARAPGAEVVVVTPPGGTSQTLIETVYSAPPAEASASGPALAVKGVLQLRCTEETWIEVTDASGQPLLARNVQPGESVGLDGALPLRVVIGNAAATQLSFRGQPVNLAARTRDNVARLELPSSTP